MNKNKDYNEDYLASNSLIKISFLLIIIISIIFISLWTIFEWPSSVEGRFSLTKGCKPYSITTSTRGIVAFLANPSDLVTTDQPIAYLTGHGDYNAISQLKLILENSEIDKDIIDKDEYYGDLSMFVYSYITSLEEYHQGIENKIADINIKSNIEKINGLQEKIYYIRKSLSHIEEESEILKNEARQDSFLLSKGAVTKFEADKSKLLSLQKDTELLNLQSELATLNKAIIELQNENNLIKTTKYEEIIRLENTVKRSHAELKEAVIEWFYKFELRSPINGIIENPFRINNLDFVDIGTEIFRILPIDSIIRGEVFFEAINSYGIKDGMKVKLILDEYNENEYGYLIGTINEISSSILKTNEKIGYTCIVSIDISEQPNFHASLDFKYGMEGVIKFTIRQKTFWEKFKIWLEGKRSLFDC